MNPAEVVIGIIHANIPPWSAIALDGQGSTWLAEPSPPGVRVFYVHGSGAPPWLRSVDAWHERVRWSRKFGGLEGKALRLVDLLATRPFLGWVPAWSVWHGPDLSRPRIGVRIPDSFMTATQKELALMEFFLTSTKASWLYTTTSSSYVRQGALLRHVSNLTPHGVYAGTPIQAGSLLFASGANRLLSRDVVELVLRSRRQWDRGLLEDVGMGRLMQKMGIPLQELASINIDCKEDINAVSRARLQESFHYRLKSGPLMARNDVELMRSLHGRLVDVT